MGKRDKATTVTRTAGLTSPWTQSGTRRRCVGKVFVCRCGFEPTRITCRGQPWTRSTKVSTPETYVKMREGGVSECAEFHANILDKAETDNVGRREVKATEVIRVAFRASQGGWVVHIVYGGTIGEWGSGGGSGVRAWRNTREARVQPFAGTESSTIASWNPGEYSVRVSNPTTHHRSTISRSLGMAPSPGWTEMEQQARELGRTRFGGVTWGSRRAKRQFLLRGRPVGRGHAAHRAIR